MKSQSAPYTPGGGPLPNRARSAWWLAPGLGLGLGLGLTWALAVTSPAAAGEAQVYRCQAPGGMVEFRQEPCAPGSPGEALRLEDHPTGWNSAPGAPSAKPDANPKPKAAKKARSGPSARERQAETCQKKQQQVEDIDRRLRLGTKPRQGTDLRHRRRGLEEYLYENCD